MLEVIETVNGLGLVTKTNIKQGDCILRLDGEILDQPTRYSIQIGPNQHILDDQAVRINHSCTANSLIDGKKMTALRDIKATEEITFDYNLTEDVLAHPFECSCCGKTIKGRLARVNE